MRFHYTMHSVPCTGVELSVCGPAGRKRVLVTGDSDSRAHIEQAAAAGAISPERHRQLMALYAWDGDLVLADAGGGAIHGAAADFEGSRAEVVHFHTGKLEAPHRHTLARAGYRYTLIADHARPSTLERGIAQRALAQGFPGADPDAIAVLLDAATVISVNTGQIVLRQGDDGRELYVVITGELSVVVERAPAGEVIEIGRVDAGEVFGERAGVASTPRAATVIAVTPTRLVRVPGDEFIRFALAARLPSALPELWLRRRALDGVRMLDGASSSIKSQLAQHAVPRAVEAGATLIRESSTSDTVFVLVSGRAQVYKGQSPLLVGGAPIIVEPGTLIGETAPFLERPRNASIVTLDACEVLAIRGKDFKRIVERAPQLFCHISRTVRQRAAA